MEKEQILTTLKEKLGTTSLSDRTLADYVNLNLPAEGTEPDDAFFSRHVGVLKSLGGNFDHDVAEKVSDFKKNYKPQDPSKKQDEKHEEVEDKGNYETLLAQFNELKERLDKSDKEQSEAQIRRSAKSAAASLKIAKQSLFDDCFAAEKVQENQTSEQFLNAVKLSYEKKLKSYFGNSEEPYGSEHKPGGGSGSADEKWLKDRFKEKLGGED